MSDMVSIGSKKRPTVVTVIGVLSIIFCGLGLLATIWGIAAQGLFGQFKEFARIYRKIPDVPVYIDDMFNQMMIAMGEFMPVFLVSGILCMLVYGIGLSSGIGLLYEKKWAVFLSKLFAIANIVVVIIGTIVSGIILSRMSGFMDNIIDQMPDKASPFTGVFMGNLMNVASTMGMVLGIIFGCAYPIIVLIFMNSKKVKSFFA